MQRSVLNKLGKFGVKILWRYTDMAIFVLRCFILTHPVYDVISDVIKNVVCRQRRTSNKRFSKRKTWHCTSVAKRICEQKLESSLIKSFSEKLMNSVLFGSGRLPIPNWSCRHCTVQWRRAVADSRYLSMCLGRRYKHWFWVKLGLITFTSTFTSAVDNSNTIRTSRLLFFVEFCPLLVLVCNG